MPFFKETYPSVYDGSGGLKYISEGANGYFYARLHNGQLEGVKLVENFYEHDDYKKDDFFDTVRAYREFGYSETYLDHLFHLCREVIGLILSSRKIENAIAKKELPSWIHVIREQDPQNVWGDLFRGYIKKEVFDGCHLLEDWRGCIPYDAGEGLCEYIENMYADLGFAGDDLHASLNILVDEQAIACLAQMDDFCPDSMEGKVCVNCDTGEFGFQDIETQRNETRLLVQQAHIEMLKILERKGPVPPAREKNKTSFRDTSGLADLIK